MHVIAKQLCEQELEEMMVEHPVTAGIVKSETYGCQAVLTLP